MRKNFGINIWKWLIFLLLVCYMSCGLLIFRDYGASSDEVNQIEAGHIIWTKLCETFHLPIPNFGKIPELEDYYNRYYGQAATFPTVIIEALHGFSLDISTVLRIRHIWNYLVFFTGIIAMGILAKLNFRRDDVVFFMLLLYILTPRLFGDAFYNDRDVMLISLMWCSILAFDLFCRKSGVFQILFCSFFFALSINTRFFALVLLFLPIALLFNSNFCEKKNIFVLIVFVFVFWYLFSPVFWKNLFSELAAAFQKFAVGQQRTQETGGMAEILFFGRYFRENKLPFYYLPLWIFISTPVIPQILTGIGITGIWKKDKTLLDCFMLYFLCLGIAAVMVIRPVLYNGWRHMYFFYVPFFWFTGIGLKFLFNSEEKIIRNVTIGFVVFSSVWTASDIFTLHPYEILYLNHLFCSRTNDFDRDYWRLSTTESLKWIGIKELETFSVGETNENLDNSIIGLLPDLRKKTKIQHYNALHRVPSDYLIYNYSGEKQNEKIFPLYYPVHSVTRYQTKLAEIYKRTEPLKITSFMLSLDTLKAADGDYDTEWRSNKPQNPDDMLIMEFSEPISLGGISLLPGNDEREYARSPEVSISFDGINWKKLPVTVSGLFDLTFPKIQTKWLRVRNTDYDEMNWSVREILFYD